MTPMIECVKNWVKYKAFELSDERKEALLAVVNLAQIEYNELKKEVEKFSMVEKSWIEEKLRYKKAGQECDIRLSHNPVAYCPAIIAFAENEKKK